MTVAQRSVRLGVAALLAAAPACAGNSAQIADSTGFAAVASSERAADQPPSQPSPQGRTRAPSVRERLAIARLMHAAEGVRRLHFLRPVPVLVQDRAAIIAYARSQLDAEELQRARITYLALGLLPADIALPDLLLRLLGEQVIGYYDDRNARLIVREEVMQAFDGRGVLPPVKLSEARMTLVHELVHALQDQHLELSRQLHLPRDTDPANAFKALYEGDAMLAMSAFAKPEPGSESAAGAGDHPQLVTGDRQPSLPSSELAQAPAIVRIPLLFAYLQGLGFAAHLFAHGGWARIDRAYARPPASTEQILHPEASELAQRLRIPRLPDAAQALGAAHPLLYEDTLGELELSVYFGLGASQNASRRAAAGWGGDRLYLYGGPDAQVIAVWITTWDSAPDALEAEGAAQSVQAAEGDKLRSWVERAGRNVLIVRHATPEQHARLRERFMDWARH